MTVAWIGMGSNLDDRRAYIRRATESLAHLGQARFSSVYETEAVNSPGCDRHKGLFLNMVGRLQTEFDVLALFTRLVRIETDNGRNRTDRHSNRTLDLDLLSFGALCLTLGRPHVVSSNSFRRSAIPLNLTIPHPRMHLRGFVLAPLLEIDQAWEHPLLGQCARELATAVDQSGVKLHCAYQDLFL